MERVEPKNQWHDLRLDAGEQAVINGALITAAAPLDLQVGGGAFVQRERSNTGRCPDLAPARELYYRTLLPEPAGWPSRNRQAQLFALLGQCVLHGKTRQAQEECSSYAAALTSGDYDKALKAARALASTERIASADDAAWGDWKNWRHQIPRHNHLGPLTEGR